MTDLKTRYYAYRIRIPRWLFVRIYGEPRIVINGRAFDNGAFQERR